MEGQEPPESLPAYDPEAAPAWEPLDFFAPPLLEWSAPDTESDPEPEPVAAEPVEPAEPDPEPEPVAAEPVDAEPFPARRKTRLDPMPRPKLAALLALGFVVFLVVVNAAVVGFHAVRAKNELQSARETLQAARASISAGNLDQALTRINAMQPKTRAAAGSTSGAVWHFDEHLPFIGQSLASVGTLARSVNTVAVAALPGLTQSVTDLKGGKLRNSDGSINLPLIQQTSGSLITTSAVLTQARAQVAALPAHPLIGAIGNARTQLLGQLDGLLTDLTGATDAARLAPAMLGADGPRKYFLALMNPAESRGAGGLVGAYGIVVADKGVFSLEKVGVDDDFPPFGTPVADVSPDFTARWRPFDGDTDIRSSTDSPHFPWDAQVMTTMWRKRTGEVLNGVIAIDPAAAGSLIPAGHPLVLGDGTTLTGAQLPTYVEQTLYAKYGNTGNDGPRKAELQAIEKGLFDDLQTGGDPQSVLKALGRAAGERKLFVQSTDAGEEAILETTPLGGAMPDAPGAFVGVSVYNAIGNKMDAYLHRTITWTAGSCPGVGGRRTLSTTVTLENRTPTTPLSNEVAGINAPDLPLPIGSNRSWVSVYGSVGAVPVKATLDGQPVQVRVQSERSHPVIGIYVDLLPRQSHTLEVTWSDAQTVDSAGKPVGLDPQAPFVQPLVIPAVIRANVAKC